MTDPVDWPTTVTISWPLLTQSPICAHKSPMDARRLYSAPTVRSMAVICDQRVMLNGYCSARKYREHRRRIRFKDPESGKTLIFLAGNTTLPALTIAALYKSRCQVELFFKWIKQHLRITKFLGTSENAVDRDFMRLAARRPCNRSACQR